MRSEDGDDAHSLARDAHGEGDAAGAGEGGGGERGGEGGGGGGLGSVRDARAVLLLAAGGDEDSAAGEGAGRDAAEDDSVHVWWMWRERVMGREGGIWNQAVHVGIDADESG